MISDGPECKGSGHDGSLLDSIRAAAQLRPDDMTLRLHLAELLLRAGQKAEAISEAAIVLQEDPANLEALSVIQEASNVPGVVAGGESARADERSGPAIEARGPGQDFDWSAAEAEVGGLAPPMFVDGGDGPEPEEIYDIERPTIRLADVAGMREVKQRLEAAFLAPMRNPELRKAYAKSLRGGLLLYGPPGCGKTFIGRALAGEMGASFVPVRLNEVLDMWVGSSERNLHQIFEYARRSVPAVLFLDEVDAIGHKRGDLRNSAMRSTVNQLLDELDSASKSNEGIFVLGATNMPWEVDSALRRPGRLDRSMLVLPPDALAREGILRFHLRERPVAGVDLKKLAGLTEGYSAADLAYLCETAAERALMDSVRTGQVRFVDMGDLRQALQEVKPSIGSWLETARNVALFANEGGQYDELLTYLKKRKML